MSNPEFKVIFTETDRNTADNARQYYEEKHKKYEEILDVADYICLISALFFIIPVIIILITTTYFKTETSKSLINVMGLALLVFIISWSINLLFLERKANMYEILFEEHSKMVKVMNIILQNREYELKASESGDIWINILDDSKVIDSITVVQTGTLWNVVKIEMEFKHTYNKKYGIICGWRIKTLSCMAIRERKENETTN